VTGGANGNGTIDGVVVADTRRRVERAAVVGTAANRGVGSGAGAVVVGVVAGSVGNVVVEASGPAGVLGVTIR
jgi:hypothetical protein